MHTVEGACACMHTGVVILGTMVIDLSICICACICMHTGVVILGTMVIDLGVQKVLMYPGHLLGELALFGGGRNLLT